MQPGVGGAGARGGCLSTTPCVGRGDQAGLAAGRACRLSGSPVFCVRLHVEPSRLRGCLGLPLGQPVCQAPELSALQGTGSRTWGAFCSAGSVEARPTPTPPQLVARSPRP